MNPIEQNLNNLLDLWKKYGAVSHSLAGMELYQHVTWPNRVWLERKSNTASINDLHSNPLEKVIQQIAPGRILPIIDDKSLDQPLTLNWLNHTSYLNSFLDKHQYTSIFQLTAMHKKFNAAQDSEYKTDLAIEVIQAVNKQAQPDSQKQLRTWIEITNEAFQYQVTPNVIQGLLAYPEIKLLLFYQHNTPVASALLNVSQNTIGIHQVGVKKSMQGQGIGLKVMKEILQFSANLNTDSLVLQASKAGLPLYQKLGFNELFQINHYWIAK
jgi:ribosomal protein S18 acetylase RimI-like enzyme